MSEDNASTNIEDLKHEAEQLGVTFHPNISAAKLAAKIEEFYKSQETSAVVVADTQEDTPDLAKGAANMRTLARALEAEARKTQVVTIIDNDQRVNNVTTSCTVNCSNAYFDLGQIILPLNEKVEVRKGHLDVLRSVKIPQHMKNPNDPSVSVMVMRPRYTIQVENV